MLRNKPATIAISSVYGSQCSKHIPQIVLLREAPDFIGARRFKHAHNFYFVLFVSSGLGVCDSLNSLVCNDRLNSQWRLRHSGVIVTEFTAV